MLKAKISEIFSSIQGEGIYLGTAHIFIRFAGCNIKCGYCDTDTEKYKEYSVKALIEQIRKLQKKHNAKYISLTGGEPLLQVEFINEFLSKFKSNKSYIYLETNGILSAEFLKIKDKIDIVAMDFKLPSATAQKSFWVEHLKFLKACKKKDVQVFVKAVVGLKTKASEIKKTAQLIAGVSKNIILVLQPSHNELSEKLIKKANVWQVLGLNYLKDVRVIPQMHKLIGVR